MCENKFYICEKCGNLVGMINASGVPMMCCGQKMTELKAGTVEASREKHIPVATVNDGIVTVTVGSVEHPMVEEHSILWVYLKTDKGGQRKCLEVGKVPTVTFALSDEKPLEVYAYCNLHGLWMSEIEEVKVCPLKPVDTETNENYTVCHCNNVSYFDILDAVHNNSDAQKLLDVFEDVKNTTKCSTGCGGCYDKVIKIISETMNSGK
ncbi:MAG: (2Fe-2S)-binding protein [Clostridia bacterium]|nr:(2Fe-2S)-binding protein [Clostridia bacterium]